MKHGITLSLALLLSGPAAFGQQEAIAQYVDALIGVKDRCVRSYQELEATFAQHNSFAMDEKLRSFRQTATTATQEVSAKAAYEGEPYLRKAVLDFVKYMQSIASAELVDVKGLYEKANPTQQDNDRLQGIAQQYKSHSEALLEAVDKARLDFVAEYHFAKLTGEFCNQLRLVLASANKGFADIKGEERGLLGGMYAAKVLLPEATEGVISDLFNTEARYTFYQGSDPQQALVYVDNLGWFVRSCKTGWKVQTSETPAASWDATHGVSMSFVEGELGSSGRAITISGSKPVTGYTVSLTVTKYD
jgi:hypothetical protein